MDLSFSNKPSIGENDELAVLGWILLKGSSWTNEIANKFEYDIDSAKLILRRMLKKKLIRQFYPDPLYPQGLIACRITELQSKGIDTYGKVCERNWFCATLKGVQDYAEIQNGKGHRIEAAYLKEYTELRYVE